MCRLLGSVRSGRSATFTINGHKATLYGAYGKTDRFFDRLTLPCSEKDIEIYGKCTIDPKKGMPFRFDLPSLSAEKIEAVIKTAGLIACGNKGVIYAVRDMVVKPQEYFAAHSEEYLERGIDCWENLDEIVWLGMVDILIRNNYATERDYKDEKDDFVYFFSSLNNVKRNGLTVDPDILDEDETLTDWCTVINESREFAEYCICCIDIHSDSYVLFPLRHSLIDRLGRYARCMGYAIDLCNQ